MASNNAVEIEIKANTSGAVSEISKLGESAAAALLAADKLGLGFNTAIQKAQAGTEELNRSLGGIAGNQAAISSVINTQNKFIELGQAAGLTGDKIAEMHAKFGMQIGANAATTSIEHARTQLMSMGVAAGLSASDLQKMGASIGMTAKETEEHTRHISGGVARMAEASGMSMAQLSNVTRMLPMQLTDIVTSLASGMPAYMVAIQQGGQIKDMYGSMGLAARALSEYVIGLINPFTVAAAAAGVLALAYSQGSRETDAYRLALVNTGNAAGVTTGQMAGMASQISETVGTTGAAAESLAALAATGVVAGANMVQFAQASIYAQKGLQQDVGETAKVFESLGRSPVEASAKLNEKLNYLTAATYSQIRAAMELGDREGAASIAQQAYAAAIEERGKKMIASMGSLERAWMGVAGGAKRAWDAMLNIGREEDPVAKAVAAADKLRNLRAQLQQAQGGGAGVNYQGLVQLKAEIADQEKLVSVIQKKTEADNAAAKAQADNAALERKRIEWDKRVQAGLSPEERARRDVKTIRAEGLAAGGKKEDIDALVAAAYKPVVEKAQQAASERLKIENDYYKQLTDEVKSGEKLMQSALSAERSAGLIGEVDYFNQRKTLSDNALVDQQAAIELEIESIKRSGIAQKDKASQIAALNNQIAGLERERVAVSQQAEIDIAAARRKDAQALAAESINIQSAALESWHKLASVKDADYYNNAAKNNEDYWNARVELAFTSYENETRYALEGSQVEITARQKLDNVLRNSVAERELANKNALASSYQYAAGIDATNAKIEYEATLIGLTAGERAKALAIYDIEIEKLQKIREIKATTPEGEARDKAIGAIEVAAAKKASGEVQKIQAAQWGEYVSIGESSIKTAWDALPNGVESAAKTAWEKLKKEFWDQLYKTLAQPFVLNVTANVTGQVQGLLGVGGASGGGGVGGLLQQAGSFKDLLFGGGAAASSAASYAGAIGTANAEAGSQAAMLAAQTEAFGTAGVALTTEAAGVATAMSGLASSYGTAIGATSSAIGSQAAMLAAQTEGFGAAGLALTAEAAGVAAAGTGMMATLSAAAPWVAGGLMIANAVGLFGGDDNAKMGGTYQYTQGAGVDVWRDEAGRTRLGTDGREIGDNLIQASIQKTTDTINKVLEQIGSVSRVKTLIAGAQSSSEKPEAMIEAYGMLDTGKKFGIQGEQKLNKTASPEEVYGALQTELNRAVLDAVKNAAEIPKSVKEMLQKVDPRGIENDKFNEYLSRIIEDAQAAITEQWTGMDVSDFGDLLTGMADTSVDAAQYMADGITDSIGEAWAGRIQSQFASAMYSGVIQPIIMTATTAGMGAEAIKGQLLEAQSVIASLKSQAVAMKEVMQSDAFKGLMADIGDAMAGAQEPIKELQSYIPDTSKSVKKHADSASSASKDIADAAKKEADEKKGLQDKLDALTMTRAQLLEKERNAVNESNRALFDQLKAREAFDSANKLAQAELKKQAGLQADLIEAQGDAVTAREMRRAAAIKEATDGMNAYNSELVAGSMIATNALEDQVNAARELQSITNSLGDKYSSLQVDLLSARGDEAGAKRLKRQQELDNLLLNKSDADSAEITAIYKRNSALEDRLELESKLADAMKDVKKLQKASAADAIKIQKDVAKEQADTAKALMETVRSARLQLIGETDAGAKMQADAAREFIRNAAETARKTGYLPDEKRISEAISALQNDQGDYISIAEETYANMLVAGDLAGLEDVSKSTLDKATAAQKVAEAQLAALEGSNAVALQAAQAAQNDAARQLTELVGIREALVAQKAIAASIDKSPAVGGSTGAPYRAAPVEFDAGLKSAATDKYQYYASTIGFAAGANKMLEEIKGYGYTMPEAEVILGLDAGTLTDFAASIGIPAFAAGANVIPQDMLAVVHEGEAIIPAPFNPYLRGGGYKSSDAPPQSNAEMVAELKSLRAELTRITALLENVTEGGNAMRTTTA